MPIPKSKPSAPTGSVKAQPAPANGSATAADKKDTWEVALLAGGKPDKQAHDKEQERIKSEIDALQAKLSDVREKINFATQPAAGNEQKAALRAELDTLREHQSSKKLNRGKLQEQLKSLQDRFHQKVKELQNAKSKVPFKTVAEIETHIQNLEKQVESGTMKLADEKRALQEISTVKRSRRIVEGFQAEQEAIDADRQQIDELRKQLDDPEARAISDRYETIQAQLDELKKGAEEAYAGRSKLFEERDAVNSQVKALLTEKREKQTAYREAHDRYWAKVNEDRTRRAEKLRAQRAAEETQKKLEIAQRIRDEASIPAFQAQIEDCQTLIDFFTGKASGNVTYKSTGTLFTKAEVAGVPKLEIRKVDDVPEGAVVRKKKGDDEDNYFVGGKGKKGKKGGASKANELPAGENGSSTPSSDKLNISYSTLSALLSLSIPAPGSSADVPRVIDDLSTKKAWFEANQARVTAENVAKAEAEIARLSNSSKDPKASAAPSGVDTPASEPTPSNDGSGENPLESVPTPQTGENLAAPVLDDQLDNELVAIKENEAVA